MATRAAVAGRLFTTRATIRPNQIFNISNNSSKFDSSTTNRASLASFRRQRNRGLIKCLEQSHLRHRIFFAVRQRAPVRPRPCFQRRLHHKNPQPKTSSAIRGNRINKFRRRFAGHQNAVQFIKVILIHIPVRRGITLDPSHRLGLSHGAIIRAAPAKVNRAKTPFPLWERTLATPFNSEHSATFRHTATRTFFQPRVPVHKLQALRSTHFKGNKFSTDARPRLQWHPFFRWPFVCNRKYHAPSVTNALNARPLHPEPSHPSPTGVHNFSPRLCSLPHRLRKRPWR